MTFDFNDVLPFTTVTVGDVAHLSFSRMHAIHEHTDFFVVIFVSGCISELAFMSRNGFYGCEESLFVAAS